MHKISRASGVRNLRPRVVVPSKRDFATPSYTPINRCWMTPRSALSTLWNSIAAGAKKTRPTGSAMAAFEYRHAQEIRDIFRKHEVRYRFFGKPGAILLVFPDSTQDACLFADR